MTRFGLIDTTFERRAAEMVDVPPPQHVTDAHLRKGPWSGNNQLGYKLPFAPDANNRQSVLKLDEWGFPELWTISLGIDGFPGGAFDRFGVRAVISFGAGGSVQTIDVDWRNGTQISLVMNAVDVVAEFQNLDVESEGQGLFLTVQISPGNRPGGNTPVCTMVAEGDTVIIVAPPFPKGTLMEGVTLANGSNSGLIRIPPFASRVLAVPAGLTNAEIAAFFDDDVRLVLTTGNNIGSRIVQSARGSDLLTRKGIDVTGEARFAILFNDSGSPVTFTMYSELCG